MARVNMGPSRNGVKVDMTLWYTTTQIYYVKPYIKIKGKMCFSFRYSSGESKQVP